MSRSSLFQLLFSACLLSAFSPAGTTYQDRGDRHEGTVNRPIRALDVDLLAAYAEPAASVAGSGNVTLSFLPESVDSGVTIVVRERFPRKNYKLDQVVPPRPWRAKAVNTFTWPAADVLGPLSLAPRDLLPLVRLGPARQGEEPVAPVRWSAGGGPVNGYRFVFAVDSRAETRHWVLDPRGGGSGKTVFVERSPRTPFEVTWSAAGQPEGTYRLVLEGFFVETNMRFNRKVRFFHSPRW